MDFIFRPLDADAVKLRKDAQRMALSLHNARGVANVVKGGYILRAVGDGKTVVVTAIPLPPSIGGAFNALEWTGAYYPLGGKEYKHVVFHKFTSPKLKDAVFRGTLESLALKAEYRRYIASGRRNIGTVAQLWPLGFVGDPNYGWLKSPPDNTVQGQCRRGHSGAVDAPPKATHAVPCRTALLTLHTPEYRDSYSVIDVAAGGVVSKEHSVSLFRLNAGTSMRRWDELDVTNPPAVRDDIQADYLVRDSGGGGCGIIEFSTQLLGIDYAPVAGSGFYVSEGWLQPAGCFEWDATNGVIAVGVTDRNISRRIVVARYDTTLDTLVWKIDITSPPMPPIPQVTVSSFEECNGRFGMWATRAGRRLSDGTPEQPDEIILLASYYCVTGRVQDPRFYGDPNYVWNTGFDATHLYKINPVTGSRTSVELYNYVTDRFYNQNGATTMYELSHALGVTVGSAAAAEPVLICARRKGVWTNFYVPEFNGRPGYWDRSQVNPDRTSVDELDMVSVRSNGTIQVLNIGNNFPAYWLTALSLDANGRMLGWCCHRWYGMVSSNVYDPPVCEFAPGYVAILVSPKSTFASCAISPRLVICNVLTGAKVYESGATSLPTINPSEYIGISCAQHGQVVDGVATGGVLLVSVWKSNAPNPASGCFVTRDLGVTFNRVLGSQMPATAMHYLGVPTDPNPIGGGW